MFSDTNGLNFSEYFIPEKFDTSAQKMNADLVTFTEEILNGKLHFLFSDTSAIYFASNLDFRFVESFFTMRRIFSSVTSGFTTQYELDQVSIFLENCT